MSRSMKVGGALGELVEGDSEVAQAVATALATQLGSVPQEPNYGLDRLQLLDEPLTTLRPKAQRLVRRCFALSLPRAELLAVEVQDATEGGQAALHVHWQPKGRRTARVSEVRL